jgi:hypothetical protein
MAEAVASDAATAPGVFSRKASGLIRHSRQAPGQGDKGFATWQTSNGWSKSSTRQA